MKLEIQNLKALLFVFILPGKLLILSGMVEEKQQSFQTFIY